MRNSSLLLVAIRRSRMVFMASTGVISAMNLRMIHMRLSVVSSSSKSSRRVEDSTRSMAGKIRLLESERFSWISELPVPLNSSKITSSILEPVSTSAVAIIVSYPPPSMFRAAPKKRFGFCSALASTPPVSTFPEVGATVL